VIKDLIGQLKIIKAASYDLMRVDEEKRKQVLEDLAKELANAKAEIIAENKKDLALMDKDDPKYDRLLLSEEDIDSIADDVKKIAGLSHSRSAILEEKNLENGLKIQKVAVPLGVVAIIYESRPNVTMDSFVLCFKSGNACILKGGKEAFHSNQILVSLIQKTLRKHGLDENFIYLMPPERAAMTTLLNAIGLVDVCIPRGSQALINFVRENARIPFIETGAGIVHIYYDASADLKKGRLIIDNAKTRKVSVCNALDTLLIHEKRIRDLPVIVQELAGKNVEIFADAASYKILAASYPKQLLHQAKPEHFGQEFLSYKMSVKTVNSIEEAVKHIMEYSSGHSEGIIAEDARAIRYFLEHIDAAVVYVNSSTAFTDGGQFGMGAEIGISTQKLHARGPMALEALTSYKWIVLGDGHIRV
jgi:glutamate-5-semialdehyde dehydrogenase